MLYLLRTQLLNQLGFPDINTMKNIVQHQRFPSLHERLNAVTEIAMELLFSLLMNASLEYVDSLLPVEFVVSNEGGHALFEILQPVLMMTAVTTSLLVKVAILVNSLTSSS